MRIQPFRALRPTPATAGRVASVPYDVVDTDEARALAAGNPDSFLRIVRPEIDLAPETDVHSDPVYAKAAENLADFRARGVLEHEAAPALYVYRLQAGSHEQTGVVACCHIEDYEQEVIRKHERTRQDKETDRIRHVETLNAHTGPVFLTYRRTDRLTALTSETVTGEPLFDLTAPDGVRHTIWRVASATDWEAAFGEVPVAYIADGHHRAAAAAAVGRRRREANPGHAGNEEYNWLLGVLFPADQLRILPYNRCVSDLGGRSADAFVEALRARFRVTENGAPVPEGPCSASLFCHDRWYGLSWDPPATDDPVAALDVSVLQDRVFDALLGIRDPRTDTRLSFVGGIHGTETLEAQVRGGQSAAAFSLYPVTVEQMMAIADAQRIMPPKSTWFEPKLRSGLLIHTLD